MNKEPLIHKLSSRNPIPQELMSLKVVDLLKSKFLMGYSTSCTKGTDGTEPKNEADRVMDDN